MPLVLGGFSEMSYSSYLHLTPFYGNMVVYDSRPPHICHPSIRQEVPMKEKGYVIGCPNPHSVAELIVGKRIDWSKQKDEFETLADCFGITKEGYLSDESPLFSPKAVRDDSGTVYTFTDEEMQERLVDFMEKYARPEKVTRRRTTKALTRDLRRPVDMANAPHLETQISPDMGDEEAIDADGAGIAEPQVISDTGTGELTQAQISPAPKADELSQAQMSSFSKTGELSQAQMSSSAKTGVLSQAQISPAAKAGELTQAQKRARALDFLLNNTSKSINKPTNALSPMRKARSSITVKPNAYDEPYLPDGMEWKDKGYFFNETARFTDICQKSIGDCYFLSALCSVAFVDTFRIKNTTEMRYKYIDGAREETPWHRIDFYVPEKPVEEGITWWKDKKKTVQSIVVSEEILVSSSTGRNYGACGPKELVKKTSSNKSEADACWPAVYEKAYAKFLEGTTSDYPDMSKTSHIWCGYSRDTLKQILHTEEVEAKMLKFLSIDEVLDICRAAYCHPTCASIYEYIKINSKKKETHYSEAGTKSYYEENLGLFIGHEYSLLDCSVIDGTTYVVLRNPHGSNLQSLKKNPKVYHDSWGYDYGEHWDSKYKGSTYRYKGLSGNDDPNASNGIFLLEINEFKRVFSDITYYTGSEFV